jgi:hypothetical protein
MTGRQRGRPSSRAAAPVRPDLLLEADALAPPVPSLDTVAFMAAKPRRPAPVRPTVRRARQARDGAGRCSAPVVVVAAEEAARSTRPASWDMAEQHATEERTRGTAATLFYRATTLHKHALQKARRQTWAP